jgi:2-(1,2-epoxy-1,2-dihydrophenyl)acetyl-CoA isomerase
MQFDTLLFERRDGIAHVTLNRPDRLNALNRALLTDLRAAASAIDSDHDIRAVILGASGRAFCSGADLMGDDLLGDPSLSRGENIGANLRDYFNPMVEAWYHLRVPVVVAVNGIAAGAGVSLALVGDIVLAARSATFLQLFAPKLGLMPDLGGTFHLPRLVGSASSTLAHMSPQAAAGRCIDGGGCGGLGTHMGQRRRCRAAIESGVDCRPLRHRPHPSLSAHQGGFQ